jgi:hypothetical protein
MATPSCPFPLDLFPADLLQAVAQDAASDAERVAQFLDALGLRPTGEGAAAVPVRLPAFFLVGLGAALRLLAWEERGLHAPRDAGLPPAHEALREAFRAATASAPPQEKERAATLLACRVLAVFVERLAWSGRPLLGADVELGEADEDAVVDALADLLWAHRHDGGGAGPRPTHRG